jgi:HEAT repeat protein
MPTAKEFARVLEHLQDTSQSLPAADLYYFSDLAGQDLEALEAAWPEVPVERRRGLMQDLDDLSEANFEVTFESVFRLGLEDEDAEVRTAAIDGLWESESPDLIAPLLDALQNDPAPEVRAAAASALGRFVYLGETDEIPARQARRVEDAVLAVAQGEDAPEVRRRALEAIAFSGREEVPPLIEAAYHSSDELFRVSALFAMGRSADDRWAAQVLAELDSSRPEMRYEAARAAGELELTDAVASLARSAEDGDPQVREASIWSLGLIGGPEAKSVLLELLALADDDEADFIQDALDNLAFTDEVHDFSMLMLDDEDDDEGEFSLN